VHSSDFLASLEARREVRAATGTTGGPNGSRGAESQEQTRLLEIQPLLQDQERKRVIVERGGSFTAQYIASRKLIVDAAQAKFFPCVVMAERQTSTFALARVVNGSHVRLRGFKSSSVKNSESLERAGWLGVLK
jgi:hypothetical protein